MGNIQEGAWEGSLNEISRKPTQSCSPETKKDIQKRGNNGAWQVLLVGQSSDRGFCLGLDNVEVTREDMMLFENYMDKAVKGKETYTQHLRQW